MEVPTIEAFNKLEKRVEALETEIEQAHYAFIDFVSKMRYKSKPEVLATKPKIVRKTKKVQKLKKWTKTEIKILKQAYNVRKNKGRKGQKIKRKVLSRLSKQFGRPRTAISKKACTLGLTR